MITIGNHFLDDLTKRAASGRVPFPSKGDCMGGIPDTIPDAPDGATTSAFVHFPGFGAMNARTYDGAATALIRVLGHKANEFGRFAWGVIDSLSEIKGNHPSFTEAEATKRIQERGGAVLLWKVAET